MPTNKRKREDLRRSSNAAHQAKLSFKKQKSSVSETEEVSFKLFISKSYLQNYCIYFDGFISLSYLPQKFLLSEKLLYLKIIYAENRSFLCDDT